jgi:hypothetical protein
MLLFFSPHYKINAKHFRAGNKHHYTLVSSSYKTSAGKWQKNKNVTPSKKVTLPAFFVAFISRKKKSVI